MITDQVPMEILLIFLFLAAFISSSSSVSGDPFSEALLSFKSEIVDKSSSLSDWNLPSSGNSSVLACCSWSGVKCDENSSLLIGLDLSMKNLGGVISGSQFHVLTDVLDLNMSYNGFSGEFPGSVFNLTNLRSLDISRNNFSGHFPKGASNLANLVVLDAFSNSFSGPLPAEISQIAPLRVLNFAGSYFSGPIPADYGFFKNLDFIHLAGNFLSGEIPPELGMLKTVSHMEIGYNFYEGSIPWQMGNCSLLQYLDIAGANLSGPIPKSFSNLTSLESLFLFRNQLNGQIPWEFGNLVSLKSLDLSDNLLSGPIPESFSELKSLRLLSLMYNELSGTVPEAIAELPSLDTLLIWSNFFSGSLPRNLGMKSNLKYVDVSTNDLVGEIPPSICANGVLLKLILFSNNFTGELHPSLSNCSTLIRLRIEDNLFSGEFSSLFSNLPDMTYMDLSGNRFEGGLTNDILNMSKLEYLNISNNPSLGGLIPENMWSLSKLQNFSASYCSISGIIPPFASCESVMVLEFGWNNLSGSIPETISNCQKLVAMDLSRNKLSGNIPIQLANISSLKLLNVSYNNISGSIPQEKAFKTMDVSAFLGNSMLCGEPLKPCYNHGPNGLELGSRRTQKFAWVLITSAVIALLIAIAVFGLLHLRRKSGWRMVSFIGLPGFAADDVLRSFNPAEVSMADASPHSVCKAVLPTGITVSVKMIEWESRRMESMIELIHRIGNARHKNLTRLLGFVYNKNQGYLLYDHCPDGNLSEKMKVKKEWETKFKIILGVARGLCFLHHDCVPAIPHGDLKASNVVFDENMEPQLSEYGLSSLLQLSTRYSQARSTMETGGTGTREQLYKDVFNFGELILKILMNSDLGVKISSKEALLREILDQNNEKNSPSDPLQKSIASVLDVALLCTRSRASDRPSMEDALRLLSGLKPPQSQRK